MKRYVVSFDTDKIKKNYTDVLIIGAGIAGLYTALMLPEYINVTVLSKGSYKESNSYLAQGGVAAPMDEKNDSPKKLFADTMSCGKGLSNIDAVWTMVKEAKENILKLEQLGVVFDKDKNGNFVFGNEGAHSMPRIVRSGDHTGKIIMEALYSKAKERPNITIRENVFVIDILTDRNNCVGVIAVKNEQKFVVYAKNTVLATGGIGHLYPHTTNAEGIQGDGIAMALRAGGYLKNMSYTQFHPTVFYDEKNDIKQNFLISEAVRGEGALLYNEKGQRFMEKIHPMKELAPRDIVSTAIIKQIKNQSKPYVYLDITHWEEDRLKERFPTIFEFCKNNGYNMAKDLIPVAPKMHYFMGGIKVDLNGQTSMKNLYACGECACTGVHGKNRLASNSLLEAIVFGRRIAKHIQKYWIKIKEQRRDKKIFSEQYAFKIEEKREIISNWMGEYFGIDRTTDTVSKLKRKINKVLQEKNDVIKLSKEDIEKLNAILVMNAMVEDELILKNKLSEGIV